MRLTILGSNGTYPTPGRPTSGYLLQHEETSIWMDTGSGTFAALQRVIDFTTLDALVISHVHADHCLDVLGFYHAVKYGGLARTGIPTYVPAGLAERLKGFLGDPDHPLGATLDFRVQDDQEHATISGIEVDFAVTDHPVPTLGVRATDGTGRVLAYSADTGPQGEWSRIADGADLFLCEATYQGSADEKPWSHHLTAGEAGQIARRVGAKALMLTHIWPALDPERSVQEAEHTFGKPVGLAVPGMVVNV
ncbi:MAG TPA: MBL fold metallo-hydrolase [Acidimicrobiia bacterium]|nr:MBL fold metallo-hydrolase [Acidimicrobiia bacterium]